LSLKPYTHPVQPSPTQILQKALELKNEWSCKHVFLATEDASICQLFKDAFADSLLLEEQERLDPAKLRQGDFIANHLTQKQKSGYALGLEYLQSIYPLSRCDCLCAGETNGTLAALMMSPGYEQEYLFDLGIYPFALKDWFEDEQSRGFVQMPQNTDLLLRYKAFIAAVSAYLQSQKWATALVFYDHYHRIFEALPVATRAALDSVVAEVRTVVGPDKLPPYNYEAI
jgi:hypothetical protein